MVPLPWELTVLARTTQGRILQAQSCSLEPERECKVSVRAQKRKARTLQARSCSLVLEPECRESESAQTRQARILQAQSCSSEPERGCKASVPAPKTQQWKTPRPMSTELAPQGSLPEPWMSCPEPEY